MDTIRLLLSGYLVGIYWLAEILKALNAPDDHDYTLLSPWDRLTPDEHWQLDNFGVIRKDFMGWFIDETVKGLLEHDPGSPVATDTGP